MGPPLKFIVQQGLGGPPLEFIIKDIQIILRLFLVIAMYCQASSSQFYKSLNLLGAGKEA